MGLLIIKMLFKARRLEDPQVSARRQNREAQGLHSEALQNIQDEDMGRSGERWEGSHENVASWVLSILRKMAQSTVLKDQERDDCPLPIELNNVET